MELINLEVHWDEIRGKAVQIVTREPALKPLLDETVLERTSFAECLTYRLARKLVRHAASINVLHDTFMEAFSSDPVILQQIAFDMKAVCERDPACPDSLTPLLYFKGFQALICYRISHHLWQNERNEFALYLQSLISETFAVDIHPAAKIGYGILLDHATGFVAGETSVIENNVSILHEVTLGGTGKDRGDRHPKVRSGVLLGAGAQQNTRTHFRMPVAAILAGAAECDFMQDGNVVFNDGGLPGNEAGGVVQQNAVTDFCGRMNVHRKGF